MSTQTTAPKTDRITRIATWLDHPIRLPLAIIAFIGIAAFMMLWVGPHTLSFVFDNWWRVQDLSKHIANFFILFGENIRAIFDIHFVAAMIRNTANIGAGWANWINNAFEMAGQPNRTTPFLAGFARVYLTSASIFWIVPMIWSSYRRAKRDRKAARIAAMQQGNKS